MEGKEHKELKASSNEAESLESTVAGDDSIGTSSAAAGRYYECIFCRRGFSTAQALGGHMNIHRRDRPRIRPTAAPPPPKREDGYHPNYFRENYIIYFRELSPSTESNSLRERPTMEERKGEEDWKEREMDLELRLGHSGRHEEP